MDQRPFSRLFRYGIAGVVSLTLLLGPLAPMAFAQSVGPGTPSSAPGAGAGGGIPVATLADTGRLTQGVYDTIWTQITRAVMVAFFNGLQIFFGQIAYDAANYIATAGQGNQPVFYLKDFGRYMQNVASDAAGDFIGSLSSDQFFRNAGFDLCRPRDVRQLLRLQLSLGNFFPGLNGRFQRPAPRCQFRDILTNWNTLFTTLSNQDVFQNINTSLNTNASDVGVSLNVFNRFNANISAKALAAQLIRQEGGGFKAMTNILSGDVKTPSAIVSESTKEAVVRNPNASQLAVTGAMLSTGFQQGALQLLQYTASIFLNTLASKLLRRVFEQGLGVDLPGKSSLVSADTITTGGKTDTRNANIDLRTPNLFKTTDFEVMADFIACPQTNRGTWNCTMDQSLAQAIQSQSESGAFTVRDALARNFLHPDWRLIPESRVRENTDPQCFTFGYCAGNLRKMRLLRILSVGFEFAANAPENVARCASSQGCVTLREVVDGFAQCMHGARDHANPWCHLVDPNWVVTLPQQQCSITGFGETLLTPQLGQRREECQDVKTCLKRNDKGECLGAYGYCMSENTVYRFGADECPARFATCRGYQTRSGTNVSYLRNTLDYGVCNADNVGCLWYASSRDPAADQPENWIGTTSTGPRVYFDKTMESCPEGEEGCTKLLAISYGRPALNLVLNSSFERLTGDEVPRLQRWYWTTPADRTFVLPVVTTGTVSADGLNSVDLVAGQDLGQTMAADPSRVYTISFFARKQTEGLDAAANLDVDQYADALYRTRIPDGTGSPMARDFRSEGCFQQTGGPYHPRIKPSPLSAIWQRYECSFLSASTTRGFQLRFSGDNVLVDAAQLEESEFANFYVDGVNPALPTVHLKVAPDEFACSGASGDRSICSKFATVCRQSEAGCQGYTDARSGGPEVPAIVTQNDLCPQSCVGYNEFRKLPSSFDLTHDLDERFNDPQDTTSTFFIPATGQSCSQAEVGCEAFTNLEASAAGGEQTGYFSYLRSCRKPGPDSKTYFTWEGSDVTGYQLRTWSLIKEATTPAGPMIVLKRSNGDLTFKDPARCTARSWGVDADCRQFYDADGNAFYRFFSQTVLSTPQCASYRLNITNRADCELTDGTYNAASGECLYQAYAPGSTVCRKEAAGCRGYAGSAAGNVLLAFSESFRTSRGAFTNGTLSSEALLVGDRSLRLDAATDVSVETSAAVSSTDQDLFRVSFWAKSATVPLPLDVRAVNPDNTAEQNAIGTVTLTPDWQRFTLGPFQGVPNTADMRLSFFVPSAPRPQIVYLDEVSMSRIQDVTYLIEESWNTPNACDRTLSGVPAPQAQLGCRAYRSRTNQTLTIRQFSNLCRQQAIGCTAFVDTRNSEDIAQQTFVLGDRPNIGFPDATTTRAADRYLYLIDEPSKRCRAENASCRAFGKPNFYADRQTIQSYTTVYFKDDITKYDAGLCRPSELFCEDFTAQGSKEYFRDPQNHACEYKTDQDNVVGAPDPTTKFSGWFIKGTTRPCYPNLLADGRSYTIALRADPAYAGYGGMCEPEFNECTEFRDPNDTTDPTHRTGKPYFFLKNEKIDTRTCAGNTDPTRGCILLRDMGDAFLKYSSAASYKKFADGGYSPIVPVDCSQTPADPVCAALHATNDANLIVKTKIDRDCSQWLGCSSGETVLDPASNRYRDICTSLSLCDKASDTPGDIYCANYVNRESSSTEPMFTKGSYFDSTRYSARTVGLGLRDYTGYAIPDSFLVSDLVSRRVAIDGLPNDKEIGYRYAGDYRLVAAVPMANVRVDQPPSGGNPATYLPGPDRRHYEAVVLNPRTSGIALRYPSLSLCQHLPTGRIGFFSASDADSHKPMFCFLPVRSDTDSYDFQNISQKFQSDAAGVDQVLTHAYPPPECRAYPEVDSPFPASFVTDWDLAANPPKPKAKIAGYPNVATCEYGENCACTYKRAEYQRSAVSKFFSPSSQNIPPGICQGGPRDGQTCLPDTVFQIQGVAAGDTGAAQKKAVEEANASVTCGPVEGGGTCVPFSRISVIRGVFGQCLERDTTRSVGNNLGNNPCLTWNPNPVLFGDKDQYHFDPQAGYSPPENSGSYYCTSLVRPSQNGRMNYYNFADGMPGLVRRMHYLAQNGDDQYIVGTYSGPNFFDGVLLDQRDRESGSLVGKQCDRAMDHQENPKTQKLVWDTGGSIGFHFETTDQNFDRDALKLVATGKNSTESYSETFYKINATNTHQIGPLRFGQDPISESSIANFTFQPIVNPGGRGRLACGYQADWVDSLGEVDYTSETDLAQKDQQWHDKFNQNFSGIMNRGSEEVFANPQNGRPYKMPCIQNATSSSCYMKTWEVNYRSDGKEKFDELFGRLGNGNTDYETGPIRSLEDIRLHPVLKGCAADKPYFSIRAVFESFAGVGYQGDRSLANDFKKSEVRGPWRFVGFWVTACGGSVEDTRYIYMYVDIQSTDICRELAETRSVRSRQDAAFTDRVWKDGQYKVPVVTTQYTSRFSPFSSALNTKPPGRDPLIQSGAASRGFSKLEQPALLGAGSDSYYRSPGIPNNKWAYLSNVFARIYRVYRYENVPVTKADRACFGGPHAGEFCSNAGDPKCSLDGECVAAKTIPSDLTDVKFCNALSGINAGLTCSANDRNSDACHLGPIVKTADGGIKILRKACVLNTGWTGGGGSGFTRFGVPGVLAEKAAAGKGAFVCEPGSVRSPSRADMYCSKPEAESADCPLLVTGSCEVDPTAIQNPALGRLNRCRFNPTGTTPNRTDAQALGLANADGFVSDEAPTCFADSDCHFDEYSFWSVGPVPYGVQPGPRFGGGTVPDIERPLPGDVPGLNFYFRHVSGDPTGLWGPIYSVRSSINLEGDVGWCRDEELYASTIAQVGIASPLGTGNCLYSTTRISRPDGSEPQGIYTERFNLERPGLWNGPSDATVRVHGMLQYGGEDHRFPGTGIAFTHARRDNTTFFNIAACESVGTSTRRNYLGRCEGGVFEDRLCRQSGMAPYPPTVFSDANEPIRSRYSCNATPGNDRSGDYSNDYLPDCRPVSNLVGQPVPECRATGGDSNSNDPDLDNNSCTHGIGYQPRKYFCPDPNNEYCGLISYDASDRSASGSLNPNGIFPLPTDVTMGHYTPDYLGLRDLVASTYNYISYKEPRPPRMAAPDLTRCASPGQCEVLLMDAFTLNGRAEGVENIAGDQHKSSIAFYGWADHNQMPIRRMVVDWGDSYTQELPDAKIKNHKPFCGVQKECYVAGRVKQTGLTCGTDADCPPAAGLCKSTGFCSKKQNVMCADDNDCQIGGGDDTCVVRTLFGNSPEACETNYFEFEHVYKCPANASSTLPLCAASVGSVPTLGGVPVNSCFFGTSNNDVRNSGFFEVGTAGCASGGIADCRSGWDAYIRAWEALGDRSHGAIGVYPPGMTCVPPPPGASTEARCSRDPNRSCDDAHACAAGDTCVPVGLAPVGGCWDPSVNTCRFTPRVQIEDNWGWCTGECRNGTSGGGLTDNLDRHRDPSSLQPTPPPVQGVNHPFGGCYAGVPLGASESSAIRVNKPPIGIINSPYSSANECASNEPIRTRYFDSLHPDTGIERSVSTRRPWNVFQGSIQLRVR